MHDDDLLTPAEVSAETRIPERTLSQWRYLGRGPTYLKLGGHVRYERSALRAWREASACPTGNTAA